MSEPEFEQRHHSFLQRQHSRQGTELAKWESHSLEKFSEMQIVKILIIMSTFKSRDIEYKQMELLNKMFKQNKIPGF